VADRQSWVAHPSKLRCAAGHRLALSGRAGHVDWLADGIAYVTCRACQPTSYGVAIVSRRPTPWASCYALSKTEYETLMQLPDDLTVLELLELIHVTTEG